MRVSRTQAEYQFNLQRIRCGLGVVTQPSSSSEGFKHNINNWSLFGAFVIHRCLNPQISLSLFLFLPPAVLGYPDRHHAPAAAPLALNCLEIAGASLVGRVMGLQVPWRGRIFGLATVSNLGYLRACVSTIRLMIPNALSARDSPPRRGSSFLEIRGIHPHRRRRHRRYRSFCERLNIAICDGRVILNGDEAIFGQLEHQSIRV